MPSDTPRTARAAALAVAGIVLLFAAVGLLLLTPSLAEDDCTDWAATQGHTAVEFLDGKKSDNCRAVDAAGQVVFTTAHAPWWTTVGVMSLFVGAAASVLMAGKYGIWTLLARRAQPLS